MLALSLTFAVFGAWWLIGVALLAAVGADTGSLRIALTAPLLGTTTTVLPLFVVSHAGVAMEDGAPPVLAVVLLCSIAIIVWRRPALPLAAAPVVVLCLVDLLLVGRPMFQFGFDWIANANDDMANYVLSATQLLHHGLLTPLDVAGLAKDRDYASTLQSLHSAGSRPGSDITLAALAAVTARPPYALFMPLILALNLCMICGAGALAMQAARRWWAASVAAALLVVSPQATFGALQQLLPQVWGLGLAAALFALLMRVELHDSPGPSVRDLVPIALLAVTLVVVYVELAAPLVAAYGLYVAWLVVRRRIAPRPVLLLWGTALALALIVLNSYFFRELDYVRAQASGGVRGGGANSLFGFALVPAALPGILGIQLLPPNTTSHLGVSILVAVALLAATGVACLITSDRGVAASIILLSDLILGVFLASRTADFGLYKLYMYIQPPLAAAVAVWFSSLKRRPALAVGAVLLAVLAGVSIRNESVWIDRSRNPIDLPHASSPDLLPAFRRSFARTRQPVVAVTENPTLGKLEAAGAGDRPLYFVSSYFFANLVSGYGNLPGASHRQAVAKLERLDGWEQRTFTVFSTHTELRDSFPDSTHASRLIASGRCALILPTGSQAVFNRWSLPEGSQALRTQSCAAAKDVVIFTVSSLGQGFYLPTRRKNVSFYQLEPDYFFRGHTFAGFGRYVLLRVVGFTPGSRLEVDLTKSLRHDGANLLPPAAVVGAARAPLPLVGRGSARVFSPPVRPQLIGGQPYVLLDMGQDGRLATASRSGLEGLYGDSVNLDPRYLTSYVRDVSLVTDAQYRGLHAPLAVRRFPSDLGNPQLEYSGIYEDGWASGRSYLMLAGGPAADLVVRAEVLPRPGQHLDVLVDGRPLASRDVSPGPLALRVQIPAATSRRRIELRWAGVTPLAAPDLRPAAALMEMIGIVPRRSP